MVLSVLICHIIIALSSVVYSSYAFMRPSSKAIKINYLMVGATIVSGTYLVIITHASLVSACITGLCYLAGVMLALSLAQRRLAAESYKKNTLR